MRCGGGQLPPLHLAPLLAAIPSDTIGRATGNVTVFRRMLLFPYYDEQ